MEFVKEILSEKGLTKISKFKVNPTMTLREMYGFYNMETLKDILRSYQVKGYSKLKKPELVEIAALTVLSSIEDMKGTLSSNSYDVLEKAVLDKAIKYDGSTSAEEMIYRGLAVPYNNEGEAYLCFAEEIVEGVKSFILKPEVMADRQLVEKASKLMALAGYRYGVMKVEELVKIIQGSLADEFLSTDQVRQLVLENMEAALEVDVDNQLVYSPLCSHPVDVYKEMEKYPQVKHPLSIEDAEIFDVNRFLNVDEAHKMIEFLTKKTTPSRAFEYVEVSYLLLNYHHSEMDIINFFQEQLTFDGKKDLGAFIDVLVPFMNTSPRWILGGNVPTMKKPENQTYKSEKKVGRNDPCPCGSGKKYKKCCLNK